VCICIYVSVADGGEWVVVREKSACVCVWVRELVCLYAWVRYVSATVGYADIASAGGGPTFDTSCHSPHHERCCGREASAVRLIALSFRVEKIDVTRQACRLQARASHKLDLFAAQKVIVLSLRYRNPCSHLRPNIAVPATLALGNHTNKTKTDLKQTKKQNFASGLVRRKKHDVTSLAR
jgi:hypothetical protein